MTREEAERELIAENCPCFFDLDELVPVYEQVPEWVITERIARREAEVRVKLVERILHEAINLTCSCGGRGPDDPKACVACQIWHDYQVLKEKP